MFSFHLPQFKISKLLWECPPSLPQSSLPQTFPCTSPGILPHPYALLLISHAITLAKVLSLAMEIFFFVFSLSPSDTCCDPLITNTSAFLSQIIIQFLICQFSTLCLGLCNTKTFLLISRQSIIMLFWGTGQRNSSAKFSLIHPAVGKCSTSYHIPTLSITSYRFHFICDVTSTASLWGQNTHFIFISFLKSHP